MTQEAASKIKSIRVRAAQLHASTSTSLASSLDAAAQEAGFADFHSSVRLISGIPNTPQAATNNHSKKSRKNQSPDSPRSENSRSDSFEDVMVAAAAVAFFASGDSDN